MRQAPQRQRISQVPRGMSTQLSHQQLSEYGRNAAVAIYRHLPGCTHPPVPHAISSSGVCPRYVTLRKHFHGTFTVTDGRTAALVISPCNNGKAASIVSTTSGTTWDAFPTNSAFRYYNAQGAQHLVGAVADPNLGFASLDYVSASNTAIAAVDEDHDVPGTAPTLTMFLGGGIKMRASAAYTAVATVGCVPQHGLPHLSGVDGGAQRGPLHYTVVAADTAAYDDKQIYDFDPTSFRSIGLMAGQVPHRTVSGNTEPIELYLPIGPTQTSWQPLWAATAGTTQTDLGATALRWCGGNMLSSIHYGLPLPLVSSAGGSTTVTVSGFLEWAQQVDNSDAWIHPTSRLHRPHVDNSWNQPVSPGFSNSFPDSVANSFIQSRTMAVSSGRATLAITAPQANAAVSNLVTNINRHGQEIVPDVGVVQENPELAGAMNGAAMAMQLVPSAGARGAAVGALLGGGLAAIEDPAFRKKVAAGASSVGNFFSGLIHKIF